ncbi:RE1 [Symbiodinium sp. CCMP2592]|nr:RE1 [Symbiodinium sp. CCMP2592]
MVRNRRASAPLGDQEATGMRLEDDYRTALSQGQRAAGDVEVPVAIYQGEASPNTLEQGGGPGPSLGAGMSASPFHSEKVKNEIALRQQRPLSLDEDEARILATRDRTAKGDWVGDNGAEPNYAETTGGEGSAEPLERATGPRIARVEPSAGADDVAVTADWHGGALAGFAESVVEGAKLAEAGKGPRETTSSGQAGVHGDDELIPEERSSLNVEALLVQMMEENRALKRRLEQVELRSHSSWHSGTQGDMGMTAGSPMSFSMPFGSQVTGPGRGFESLVQAVPPEGAWFPDFPGFKSDVGWVRCGKFVVVWIRLYGVTIMRLLDGCPGYDTLCRSIGIPGKLTAAQAQHELNDHATKPTDVHAAHGGESSYGHVGLVGSLDGTIGYEGLGEELEVPSLEVREWIQGCLDRGEFSDEDCLRVLQKDTLAHHRETLEKLGFPLEEVDAILDKGCDCLQESWEFDWPAQAFEDSVEETKKEWLEWVLVENQAECEKELAKWRDPAKEEVVQCSPVRRARANEDAARCVAGTEERIIVKPPHFLVELGILSKEDRWWIRKALYGLPTSPRDWGRYRDGEFEKMRIPYAGGEYHLVQLKSDDALWVLRKYTKEGLGDVEGILIVYVDDLALFAEPGLALQFIKVLRDLWKTSEPEWIKESAVTFCGLEISRSSQGYRLSQVAYIRELLQRYNVTEDAAVPISKWTDPDLPDSVSASEVKEAQAITGALLWVATRTRPDISYAVSRCGQQATKAPQISISVGLQTLKYLRSTAEFGIEVPFEVGNPFADHGLLLMPRSEKVLEVYSDASHSPGGDRSMQSLIVLWMGVPIAWETTRQAFTTLSSAEAELVCSVHAVQLSESIQSLLDELIEADSTIALLSDNEASLRSFDQECSRLRTLGPNRLVGLALLAVIPRVRGQPAHGLPEAQGWFVWVLACLAPDCDGDSDGVGTVQCDDAPEQGPAATPEPEDDDEFSEQEWREAQLKLEEAERCSGLTFLQRAKVRKQVAAGGVVDPPNFLQRFQVLQIQEFSLGVPVLTRFQVLQTQELSLGMPVLTRFQVLQMQVFRSEVPGQTRDAAEAYFQNGIREFPFAEQNPVEAEDREDDPTIDERSTTEPSVLTEGSQATVDDPEVQLARAFKARALTEDSFLGEGRKNSEALDSVIMGYWESLREFPSKKDSGMRPGFGIEMTFDPVFVPS